MIGAVQRAWRSLRGDAEYSVTVPPMDGALNPNSLLEEAEIAAAANAPDNLCAAGDRLLFSSGAEVVQIDGRATQSCLTFDAPITSIAAIDETLAIALADGRTLIQGGPRDGLVLSSADGHALACVTGMAFSDANTLLIALGSETHPFADWKHDLMQLGSSGSVWRFDLRSAKAEPMAQKLAFPFGVLPLPDGSAIVAESWRHRLLLLKPGREPEPVVSDMPAYPARLARAEDGHGAWLALFAPRRQLTEFILREPSYRQRMMAEISPDYWVGPTLAPMMSFLEPLQGGTLKKLAAIKPWAPSRSYGLVVRLGSDWQPVESFHSRADGTRHGVMSAVEHDGRLYAASRGANAVVAVDLGRQVSRRPHPELVEG